MIERELRGLMGCCSLLAGSWQTGSSCLARIVELMRLISVVGTMDDHLSCCFSFCLVHGLESWHRTRSVDIPLLCA